MSFEVTIIGNIPANVDPRKLAALIQQALETPSESVETTAQDGALFNFPGLNLAAEANELGRRMKRALMSADAEAGARAVGAPRGWAVLGDMIAEAAQPYVENGCPCPVCEESRAAVAAEAEEMGMNADAEAEGVAQIAEADALDFDTSDGVWVVLELLGRQKLAGCAVGIEVVEDAGTWIGLYVPATTQRKAFVKTFHPQAVFAIKNVPEAIARELAEVYNVAPYDDHLIARSLFGDYEPKNGTTEEMNRWLKL